MERYDYLKAVTIDVKNWILQNHTIDAIIDTDDYSMFYDELFTNDEITGNASGSYTFNRWMAEEFLCHNLSILEDAAKEFGYTQIPLEWSDAETADVVIRCYYLSEAINNAIEEIRKENEQ